MFFKTVAATGTELTEYSKNCEKYATPLKFVLITPIKYDIPFADSAAEA